MAEDTEIELPIIALRLAPGDGVPVRCGTMLLFAGLIKLDGDLSKACEPSDEAEWPAFI
ncbi:hypothetical protein [Pseudomonas syringae]|uniref:hypothetical protein n=1 Tax=Pseudomonas syringae TaxID=317 RepID=UPI000B06D33B|nr:hypothetical protein [Pseudomonas syringae]